MMNLKRFVLPLILILCSGTGFAQSTGSGDIRGSVTDSTGALIPGVTVTVLDIDTGVSKVLTTNDAGLYDTNAIVTGPYTVTFTKGGFEKLVRGPVTVEVGFTTVNAELKVGAETQEVTVTSDVSLLQTESGDQTSTLQAKSMDQLPQVAGASGVSWENFMILLPGTTGCGGSNCNEGSSNPGQGVSSNGNLPYSNILADGASTTLSHSQNANPAIFETVDQLQVSLSSFSAQYGVGGMIINQISKGGTNRFHGSFYDYMQNSFFNSYPHFNPSVTYLRYHNFGGTVGGPILKKKAFFFFDYDQIVDHGGANAGKQTVPTAAVLGGDFSGQQIIYDPTTQTMATDSAGNPYPVRQSFLSEYGTNAIPSAMIDKVSAAFQNFYPTASKHIPNGTFLPGTLNSAGLLQNNWYSSVPQSTPYRKFFGRLDYDIKSTNRLTFSDTQSDTPVQYPSSVTSCPVNCQSGDVDNNNAQITDVWNISPTIVNEARFGYTRQLNFFADLSLGKGYASQLGWQFAKADTIPAIQFIRNYPYAWIQPSSNSVYKEHVFDPSDVVTMIRGKHILHFGGEILMYRDNSTAWGNTNAGTFQYSGAYTEQWTLDSSNVAHANSSTGLEYADFLLGLSTNWSAGVTPEYGARLKSPQMFFQDDFKLRPNLTINIGLRYQITHGWNEVHGNIDSFDPTVTNPATNTLGAYWYANTHANGRTALQANTFSTFLPRVGFAWSPKSNTTLRGGFGIYSYNWSLDNYGSGMGSPFGASGSISDTTNGIIPVTKLDGTGTLYGTSTPLPYTQASSDPTRFNGQNVGFNLYHTPVPKIYQWNFAVQRQLSTDFMAEVAYVGSHGFDLPFPTDLNAVPIDKISSNDSQYRPYQQYGNITGNSLNTVSNYNSLQASITKRMTSGVSLNFNYVWSHFLDDQDSSGWGSHQGPQPYQYANNPKANYSNSNFDVRHALKGNVVYRLPFGRGAKFLNNNLLTDALVGGWQLSGTFAFLTGQPFSVYAPGNTYQFAGSQFPNRNPGVSWKPSHQTTDEWVNPQAFTAPADGTFGNVRRNSFYGPGFQSINLSAGKTFSLPWEGVQFQIRADAQNVFNHTSWGNPGDVHLQSPDVNGVFTGPATSQINSGAIDGRTLQLGAKVSF